MVEKIYTTEQIAQFLQIHPLTVLKYIREKKLGSIKLGRIYRIRESDFQKFLDQESV